MSPLRRDRSDQEGITHAQLSVEDITGRHLATIASYVSRRVADRSDAEDVTEEVVLTAVASLPTYRGQGRHETWLLGVAYRVVALYHRRRRRRPELRMERFDPDKQPGLGGEPPEEMGRQEDARVVRQILAELIPTYREALLLKYVEDLSTREIAGLLRRSPKAVESMLGRARAAFYELGRDYFLGESPGERGGADGTQS